MDQHAGAVPQDEAIPGGRREEVDRVCAKTALATARSTGLTEGCFCIATEGRLQERGSSSVQTRVGKKQ